jgi:hypothetical protein
MRRFGGKSNVRRAGLGRRNGLLAGLEFDVEKGKG